MHSRASILVVDDDPVHLRIYGWIMNAAGFRAVTAQVLSNEVSLPEKDDFDVVVLDYRLTGTLTAVEAARQIEKKYPHVPICRAASTCRMILPPMPESLCARESLRS